MTPKKSMCLRLMVRIYRADIGCSYGVNKRLHKINTLDAQEVIGGIIEDQVEYCAILAFFTH